MREWLQGTLVMILDQAETLLDGKSAAGSVQQVGAELAHALEGVGWQYLRIVFVIEEGALAKLDGLRKDLPDVLRNSLHYRGYVHLKIMPGSERDQVYRAMQLSDRISINLEAPNSRRLADLAPHKVFMEELLQPLRWAEQIRKTQPARLGWNGKWPSLVTQFVVGAVGENDLEILSTTSYLIKQLRLARTYFSAFNPVTNTPLENHAPENPWREHRLYQSSFLLRDYGFDLEDMPFTPAGFLPLDVDPKVAWARQNLRDPIEINQADRRELLRVPGIGPGVRAQPARACRGTTWARDRLAFEPQSSHQTRVNSAPKRKTCADR